MYCGTFHTSQFQLYTYNVGIVHYLQVRELLSRDIQAYRLVHPHTHSFNLPVHDHAVLLSHIHGQ